MDLEVPEVILRSRTDPRHRAVAGSLTAIPAEDGAFDCAVCTEVLEHVPDHEAAARELARVLKASGALVLSVPQNPAPFDPAHARQGYTREDLSALLRAAGFEIVEMRDCLFGPTRWIMHYWRRPLFRLENGCPYLPRIVVGALAFLDRTLRWGSPWDLAVLARKRS